MASKMKPKLIVVLGRRWFDKRGGNTYHDVEIIVHGSGKKVIHHRTGMTYGYDEAYLQTASEWLKAQNVVPLERHSSGSLQPLWQYCQDNGIKLIRSVVDVGSRKELKGG